jgi:hypothetical protein
MLVDHAGPHVSDLRSLGELVDDERILTEFCDRRRGPAE